MICCHFRLFTQMCTQELVFQTSLTLMSYFSLLDYISRLQRVAKANHRPPSFPVLCIFSHTIPLNLPSLTCVIPLMCSFFILSIPIAPKENLNIFNSATFNSCDTTLLLSLASFYLLLSGYRSLLTPSPPTPSCLHSFLHSPWCRFHHTFPNRYCVAPQLYPCVATGLHITFVL